MEAEQEFLVSQREALFARVQRCLDTFKNSNAENAASMRPRYERMLLLETDFENVQIKLSKLNSKVVSPNKPIEIEQVQCSFEAIFYMAQTCFLNAVQASETHIKIQHHATASVTLPRIDIPQFSGDLSHWTEYQSLFLSLIDENTSLSNVQKLHYLRATLSGPALATISGFALTNPNYSLALKALTSRYQNPRLLANLNMQQILGFVPLKSSTHQELQQFIRVHQTAVDSLKAIDDLDLADFVLLSLALSNLDIQTRRAFENKTASCSMPTYDSLIEFVIQQSRTLELCGLDTANKVATPIPNKRVNSLLSTRVGNSVVAETKSIGPLTGNVVKSTACPLCKETHSLYRCPVFRVKTVEERYNILRLLKRCFNCLGAHTRPECASRSACLTCSSTQHHSLLHVHSPKASTRPNYSDIVTLPSQGDSKGLSPLSSLSCQVNSTPAIRATAMLGTVRALIRDSSGRMQSVRAVLDSGSQISAITHTLIQKLGLKVHPCTSELSGIGHSAVRVFGTVQCNIASRLNSDISLGVQALVLSSISSALPTQTVPLEVFDRYRGLSLADDRFHVPDQIDFLIGADIYPDILHKSGDMVIGGAPSALNTVFGWVVLGPVRSKSTDSHATISLLTVSSTQLERTLRSFWESEEVARPPHVDPESQLCEDHFVRSHTRDSNGRYSVALPFKSARSPLGTNRSAALNNYLNLERRLRRTPTHEVAYNEFMQDYVASQHMQPAANPSSYVIPHHCIHKVTSSSTKLRVVFNASAPDDNGVSLNQQLLSGPKLQGELPSLLTGFRTHVIAICADIRQMYRQIEVQPADRTFQHIFWRPSLDSPVVEYELNTVTYGLTPSAFIAQRVLQQVVHDDGAKFPLASLAVRSHTYVDDIVSGAPDLNQARALQAELQTLLARGGFALRKWASNHPAALIAVPADHLESPMVFSNDDQGIKILGLLWDPQSDTFSFHAQPFIGAVTKRSALSYIARIFDPLGFLTPFVCSMKIFLQQLWIAQVQWDDALPDALAQTWYAAVAEVATLTVFRIPRALVTSPGNNRVVGFCDASEKAYAAVIYLHSTNDHHAHMNLLRARSKVSPVKPLTIPKLELSAALLLSKLLQDTLPSLVSIHIESVTLFTDSTIVLAWLATPPHRLRTFVANRVVETLERSNPSDWAHVSSEDNPADCASRGLLPSQLIEHSLWLTGPDFLNAPFAAWPRHPPSSALDLELPEIRPNAITLVARVDPERLEILHRYSTLLKAQRVFGHMIRFARILLSRRNGTSPPTGTLRPAELQDALDILVKLTQQHHFAVEMRQLAQGGRVSSRIASLKPFLTPSGILKVGGRLRNSSLPEEARHPVLLPKESHLSALLCDFYHKTSLHSGPRTVQALIQQRYWIVSLRGLLRQRIHKCLTCHKFRARPLQPPMADLPAPRVQTSRAFFHVGTDFAGPFMVKSSNRRNSPLTKGYLCLFICMATKAVHLEMVSELSTQAFLACLDRFLSRRGLPSHIYSDCGRNYVGASRHLREMHELLVLSETSVSDALAARQVFWHFNPPYAPNFGGLWEAGVKSVKSLLYRLITDTPHTHEEYATLFARIEAVLNSRPLCALSADPAETADYLSPGHFLIGVPLLAPPEQVIPEKCSHLSRWHRVRQLHQSFWNRWSTEYLNTQMQRGKWTRASVNLQVGDVVFFFGAPSSPLSWPIGRVVQVHPGQDGVVRVASIRTATGVLKRPVNKLVSLPLA